MLGRERKNSNVQTWVGITLIAGLLGLAGGMWLATSVLDSSGGSDLELALRDSQDKVYGLEAQVQDIQADLEDMDSESQALSEKLAGAAQREENLEIQLSKAHAEAALSSEALGQKESELGLLSLAEEKITSLEEQVQALQAEEAEYQSNLEAGKNLSGTIDMHRLLIVELRKVHPGTRGETATYWKNLKTIASKANPALTPPVDKVILKIDNYFDWNDRSPNPAALRDEYADAYFDWLADYRISGAEAYIVATENFTRDALLAVITQLDSVVSQLD